MAIRRHILLCWWLLATSTPAIYTAKNIILTPTSPQLTLQYSSSEPSCDSAPCSCDVYVYSPQGTILKTTFLDLQIPSADEITFINTNNSEEVLKLSSIYSVIEPIYLDSSQMSITFDRCGDSSSYSYIEAEFSFIDQLQDSHVRSSGGAFVLSDAYPNVTIQTANLSSLTNLQAQMHWFIKASSAIWIKVDILEMEPGNENQVCIFDTHNTYGEWVCMTDSVSSTTWYSYDDELKMVFYVSYPGIGFTVKLTLVDHSPWNGQSLTLPACNPTVILQETQTIRFVTPFFNQSLENVRFQCRMDFTSRDPSQPASVEYKHFHFPGEVTVYSVDSQGLVNLADATDTQVTILNDSPIVSISPTHEIYVDVNKYVYSGDGSGVMVQPYNFATRGLEPLESFGVALELNDTLSAKAFTTLGYPTLPEGDINIRWLFDKVIPGSAIKVEFVDFDIGVATLSVHVDESLNPIQQLTGSTLPDNIYSETQRLTLLLRSDRIPCCKRGIHFSVTVIMLLNACTNSPCLNGGTCIDEWESFRCRCPASYYGDLCQDVVTTAVSTAQISTQSPTSHESSVTSTISTESTSTTEKTDGTIFPTLSTEDITLECNAENMTVMIPKERVSGSLKGNDLQFELSDSPSCKGKDITENPVRYIILTTSLVGCGTNNTEDDDIEVYTNRVINSYSSAIISRHYVVDIPLACTYNRTKRVSQWYHLTDYTVDKELKERGAYDFDFFIYEDYNFITPYEHYPVLIGLDEKFYFAASVLSVDNSLELSLETCKATPSDDYDDKTYYTIIENYTETAPEDTDITCKYGHRNLVGVTMNTFRFIWESDIVYLHCDLLVCGADEDNSECDTQCPVIGPTSQAVNARRRRDVSHDAVPSLASRKRLTRGPIRVIRSASRNEWSPQTSGDDSVQEDNATAFSPWVIAMTLMATIVSALSALMAVVLHKLNKMSASSKRRECLKEETLALMDDEE